MVNGRRYNHTDLTSPSQFIVPTKPWCHHHHHHRHASPPAAVVVCKGSIVHPAAATRHRTSVQELVVDAEAPSTKRHLRPRALAHKGRPSMPRHRRPPRRRLGLILTGSVFYNTVTFADSRRHHPSLLLLLLLFLLLLRFLLRDDVGGRLTVGCCPPPLRSRLNSRGATHCSAL